MRGREVRTRAGGDPSGLEAVQQAETLLLGGYEGLEEALGADHPRTREAAVRLVDLYEELGEPLRAEPFQAMLEAGGT